MLRKTKEAGTEFIDLMTLQFKWIKRHWLLYTIVLVISFLIGFCTTFGWDNIYYQIRDLFKRKKKENEES